MAENAWVVTQEDAGKRLDVFLSALIPDLTRSQAKKKIEEEEFRVNNKIVTPHKALKAGDIVEAIIIERAPLREEEKEESRTVSVSAADLRIVAETKDWILLNKQPGVLMHPDRVHPHAISTGTLIDAVIEHAPEIAKVGDDPVRPGIISRLDKDVSGLVVIAKTQDAFDELKHQFATHSVKKEYLALVHGELPKDAGDIKFRIARSSDKARMAALPESSTEGQVAWTHYDVVERFAGATLLKVQILTGRTHQIRAHLFAFEHPVMGDILYKLRRPDRKINSSRLMLQSVALSFKDPASGKEKSHRLDPDPEFDELMKKLKTKG